MPQVKIYTEFNHEFGLPEYAKPGDSGMDIRANGAVVLQPKETKLISTGIYVRLPAGYEIQVRPRSGMSLKTAFRICNSPGTVDESYLGEICVIGQNTHGSNELHISCGERIAQLVLQEVPKIEWEPVTLREDLGSTSRGDGGFGSTGTL